MQYNCGSKHVLTSHLKQSGCQSLSNAVKRWAVVSPSFGAIGRLQAQHLGAYFLKMVIFNLLFNYVFLRMKVNIIRSGTK